MFCWCHSLSSTCCLLRNCVNSCTAQLSLQKVCAYYRPLLRGSHWSLVEMINLYLLDNKICSYVSSSIPFGVWHQRLGHMSCNKMYIVPKLAMPHDKVKNFLCDICPKARQTKLPFPHSTTSSTSAFWLIHIDTWGLYHTKTYTLMTSLELHGHTLW